MLSGATLIHASPALTPFSTIKESAITAAG
jgi:hypothetical protein